MGTLLVTIGSVNNVTGQKLTLKHLDIYVIYYSMFSIYYNVSTCDEKRT